MIGCFWSRNFCTPHAKLNFEGFIVVHFHLLASGLGKSRTGMGTGLSSREGDLDGVVISTGDHLVYNE